MQLLIEIKKNILEDLYEVYEKFWKHMFHRYYYASIISFATNNQILSSKLIIDHHSFRQLNICTHLIFSDDSEASDVYKATKDFLSECKKN